MTDAMPELAAQPLDALTLPLHGSRLIEASAGTGKTWTLAALYLRLVLGDGCAPRSPEQILVMTFTRAATQELRDRIRRRLAEAAAVLRGERDSDDALLLRLRERHGGAQGAWRLDAAAQAMDAAAIFTIDAWCQRMLREHALHAGGGFAFDVVADEAELRTQAARDVWRREVYALDGAALDALLALWAEPQPLAAALAGWQRIDDPAPQLTLAALIEQAAADDAAARAALKAQWAPRVARLRAWLEPRLADAARPFDGRSLRAADVARWFDALQRWCDDAQADDPGWTDTAWQRLSGDGLRAAARQPLEVDAGFDELAQLRTALAAPPRLHQRLRDALVARGRARLAELKRARGVLGFGDMLERLHAALDDALAQRLRAQYPVALIDEFQDTSALQYAVFDRIYRFAAADADGAVLLIGDPKQSIYAFRGADIDSYIAARRDTAGRHARLDTNWRSSAALVDAVNALFARAEARAGAGAFGYRAGTDNPLPFDPVRAHGLGAGLERGGAPLPALHVVHGDAVLTRAAAQAQWAELAAEHIVQLLLDASCGVRGRDGFKRLQARDIAILVRSGAEAASMRAALRARGLRAVYLSEQDSVLASAEARDVLRWLRAVAQPRDARLLRAALATATMGLELDELAALARDDARFEQASDWLHALQRSWQRQGVLPMLREWVHGSGLAARCLAHDGGERRLTNVLHLAELLQHAAAELHGSSALLRWLEDAVAGATVGADAQQLRLESDSGLLKIVTVHKSKGLEYPYVVLPFATAFRADRGDADERERLREDLRLLYVALTRACHGVWLGAAALREGRGSDCAWHRSALGRLLSGDAPCAADAIGAQLRDAFAALPPVRIDVADAAAPPCTRWRDAQSATALAEPPAYAARFDRDWQIGSYTRLLRGALEAPPGLRDLDDDAAADAAAAAGARRAAPSPWHRFARGALAGNFLHAQLAWLADEGFDRVHEPALRDALARRCARSPWRDAASDVVDWLVAVLDAPLPPLGRSLRELERPLAEMEFWLPADDLPVAELDEACAARYLGDAPRTALTARRLRGLLMGFADLVFEVDGRWWVLDYKSNALGADDAAYDAGALRGAVARHRYDVQLLIYQLALHRLLRARLGAAYDPARHLGGGIDLFLRGIHGPLGGCFTLPADVALLQRFDALLGGAGSGT